MIPGVYGAEGDPWLYRVVKDGRIFVKKEGEPWQRPSDDAPIIKQILIGTLNRQAGPREDVNLNPSKWEPSPIGESGPFQGRIPDLRDAAHIQPELRSAFTDYDDKARDIRERAARVAFRGEYGAIPDTGE